MQLSFDVEQVRPGPAAGIDDVLIGVVDPGVEEVVLDELEQVFDRVQLWRIGRQEEQRDVVGQLEVMGDMPAGAIEDDDSLGAWRDLGADFGEMQGHGVGVGLGQHQGRRAVGFGAGGGEEIGGFVALVFWLSRPAALFRPLPGQLAFLADPGFIGEPNFYRAFRSSVADRLFDQVTEVFLNAA